MPSSAPFSPVDVAGRDRSVSPPPPPPPPQRSSLDGTATADSHGAHSSHLSSLSVSAAAAIAGSPLPSEQLSQLVEAHSAAARQSAADAAAAATATTTPRTTPGRPPATATSADERMLLPPYPTAGSAVGSRPNATAASFQSTSTTAQPSVDVAAIPVVGTYSPHLRSLSRSHSRSSRRSPFSAESNDESLPSTTHTAGSVGDSSEPTSPHAAIGGIQATASPAHMWHDGRMQPQQEGRVTHDDDYYDDDDDHDRIRRRIAEMEAELAHQEMEGQRRRSIAGSRRSSASGARRSSEGGDHPDDSFEDLAEQQEEHLRQLVRQHQHQLQLPPHHRTPSSSRPPSRFSRASTPETAAAATAAAPTTAVPSSFSSPYAYRSPSVDLAPTERQHGGGLTNSSSSTVSSSRTESQRKTARRSQQASPDHTHLHPAHVSFSARSPTKTTTTPFVTAAAFTRRSASSDLALNSASEFESDYQPILFQPSSSSSALARAASDTGRQQQPPSDPHSRAALDTSALLPAIHSTAASAAVLEARLVELDRQNGQLSATLAAMQLEVASRDRILALEQAFRGDLRRACRERIRELKTALDRREEEMDHLRARERTRQIFDELGATNAAPSSAPTSAAAAAAEAEQAEHEAHERARKDKQIEAQTEYIQALEASLHEEEEKATRFEQATIALHQRIIHVEQNHRARMAQTRVDLERTAAADREALIAHWQGQVDQARSECARELEHARADHALQLTSAHQQGHQADQARSDLEQAVANSQAQLVASRHQCQQVEQARGELERELRQVHATFDRRLDDRAAEVSTAHQRCHHLEQTIGDLEAQLAAAQAHGRTLDQAVADRQEAWAQVDQQCRTLERALAEREAELSAAHQQHAQVAQARVEVERDLEMLADQCRRERDQSLEATTRLATERRRAQDNVRDCLDQAEERFAEERSALEAQVREAQAQLDQTLRVREQEESVRAAKRKQESQAALEALTQRLDAQAESLRAMQAAVQEKTDELIVAETKARMLQQECDHQVRGLQAMVQEQQTALAAAETKVHVLEQQHLEYDKRHSTALDVQAEVAAERLRWKRQAEEHQKTRDHELALRHAKAIADLHADHATEIQRLRAAHQHALDHAQDTRTVEWRSAAERAAASLVQSEADLHRAREEVDLGKGELAKMVVRLHTMELSLATGDTEHQRLTSALAHAKIDASQAAHQARVEFAHQTEAAERLVREARAQAQEWKEKAHQAGIEFARQMEVGERALKEARGELQDWKVKVDMLQRRERERRDHLDAEVAAGGVSTSASSSVAGSGRRARAGLGEDLTGVAGSGHELRRELLHTRQELQRASAALHAADLALSHLRTQSLRLQTEAARTASEELASVRRQAREADQAHEEARRAHTRLVEELQRTHGDELADLHVRLEVATHQAKTMKAQLESMHQANHAPRSDGPTTASPNEAAAGATQLLQQQQLQQQQHQQHLLASYTDEISSLCARNQQLHRLNEVGVELLREEERKRLDAERKLAEYAAARAKEEPTPRSTHSEDGATATPPSHPTAVPSVNDDDGSGRALQASSSDASIRALQAQVERATHQYNQLVVRWDRLKAKYEGAKRQRQRLEDELAQRKATVEVLADQKRKLEDELARRKASEEDLAQQKKKAQDELHLRKRLEDELIKQMRQTKETISLPTAATVPLPAQADHGAGISSALTAVPAAVSPDLSVTDLVYLTHEVASLRKDNLRLQQAALMAQRTRAAAATTTRATPAAGAMQPAATSTLHSATTTSVI